MLITLNRFPKSRNVSPRHRFGKSCSLSQIEAMIQFESTAPSLGHQPDSTNLEPDQTTLWGSDAFNSALTGLYAGLRVLIIDWLYGWPPAWAVIVALVVGLGMHVFRLLLRRPPQLPKPEPLQVVKVTVDTPLPNGQKTQYEETFNVSAQAIRHVAHRVIVDQVTLSRHNCHKKGVCSQTDVAKIQGVMLKRNWATQDPDHPQGGIKLNRHGLAVLRGIVETSPPLARRPVKPA